MRSVCKKKTFFLQDRTVVLIRRKKKVKLLNRNKSYSLMPDLRVVRSVYVVTTIVTVYVCLVRMLFQECLQFFRSCSSAGRYRNRNFSVLQSQFRLPRTIKTVRNETSDTHHRPPCRRRRRSVLRRPYRVVIRCCV